jgi:hypothetical protein
MSADPVAEWKRSLAANLRGNWEAAECVVQLVHAILASERTATRAAALEEAAKVADDWNISWSDIPAAIRALISKEPTP